MQNLKLSTETRTGVGKGFARKLRADGHVPGVLYGHKKDPIGVLVTESDIRGVLLAHPDSAIVDLTVDGNDGGTVIVREVQRHPATGKLLHIDLQRIRLDEKVRVDVHVALSGTPVGVKEQGGILEHGTRSVTMICLPTQIPPAIEIDIAELHIHQSIRIKDIVAVYPEVEIVDDLETTLANVLPPRVEVEPTDEAEAAEATEPEIAGKEDAKDEEGGGESDS